MLYGILDKKRLKALPWFKPFKALYILTMCQKKKFCLKADLKYLAKR